MKLRLLLLTFLFSALSWGQYAVDFDGASDGTHATNYGFTNHNLNGITWSGVSVIIPTTPLAADWFNGTRSLRSRGYGDSEMTMTSDKTNGIGNISFNYSRYGTDGQTDHMVEYSTDSGLTWIQIGSGFSGTTTVQTFSETVNISGNIRIRISTVTSSGTGNRRLNIDDLTITDYNIAATFSVIYNGNGNDSGFVPTDGNTYNSSDTVTVLGNINGLGLTGHAFNGWNTVADGSGTSYDENDTFAITENTTLYAQWLSTSPPVITSSLTASENVGEAFNYDITATNSPTSYSATGLPAGLSINTTTGQITGTVGTAGVYNVDITATNAYGSDTETLVITITTGPCLSENFESGAPSGWIMNSMTYGGQNCEGSNGLVFNASGDSAITPAISNPQTLTFNKRRSGNATAWSLDVEVSTSSSGPWTNVATINTISASCELETIDLSAYNSGIYFIRLIDARSSGGHERTLDDINVYCGLICTPPSDPVGVISGVTPACNSSTLTYSETAVAPVEFYWQTTSLGTSTTNNASSSLAVTTSGDYYVRAFNTATSCWSVAEVGPYSVVIGTTASITSQPANASTVENGGASFTVATTGTGLSYQWQVDTGSGFVNVTDGLQYSGSNTASLTISNATLVMDGYVYQCIVSSACGNVTSNSATLSVIAATGTTYNPGELVFVGYDGQVNSGGVEDEYLIATLVDMIPGTTFSIVNSRYEAGAPANVRTNKWGGGGDLAEEAPYVAVITYNGATVIPAGSVIRFESNFSANWFTIAEVTIGTTTTDRTSDFVGGSHGTFSNSVNISTSGSDQLYLIQGSYTFDGTLDANEANYYLSGTLLHGITNRAAWVPLTDACNGGSSGGNSRESRLPNDLTCFNVENSSSNAVSAFYENDKEHGLATIRQIVLALSDVNNNWTLGTGRYTIDPTSSSSTRAGKTFLIGASNPPGQWVGNVNTNWFDCANWEGLAVPKLTTNVVISSSSVRDAQVDYTAQYSDLYSDIAVCNDITISDRKLIVEGNANNVLNVYGDLVISATGAVDMDDSNAGTADGTIHLYGDWTNNVDETAFEEGNGTIHFDGTTPQIISNVAPEGTEIFYDVVMNNDFSTNISNNLIATGDLLVNSGKTIIVSSDDYIQVNNNLTVNGTLNVLNNGSLIQVNDLGVNTGNISYQRIAMAKSLDYVYWSSPVTTFNVSNLPNAHRYVWNTTIPNTNNGFGNWVAASGNMIAGKGYIARASNGSATPIATTTTFNGVPNNGVISIPIQRGSYEGADYSGTNGITITRFSDNWNLIGNPYPSSINVEDFLNLNKNIEGAVRIWTHGTLPSPTINNPFYGSYQANYTPDDYITHNGVGTDSGPAGFNGFMAGGQGFLVNMLDGAADSDNVIFNNSLRDKNYDNSQFYRTSNVENSSNDKNRIWLDIINSNNAANRTLVGYVRNATNDKDRLYDAVTSVTTTMRLYSVIATDKMTIQGRELPFNPNDKVQLGYYVPATGTFSIGIAAVDGLFAENQNIYLEDTQLGIIHDLKQSVYSFSTDSGEFNDRFVLRYTNETLGGEDFISNESVLVYSNSAISVSSNSSKISAIQIYNVLGQLLFNQSNINASFFEVNVIQKSNQALIVQIQLNDGKKVVKKLIF